MDRKKEYQKWLAMKYNLTNTTKKNYYQMLKNLDLENLGDELLQLRMNKSDKTFNLTIAALKSFMAFLKERIPQDPLIQKIDSFETISSPRSRPHKPYQIEQVKSIMRNATGWRRTALAIALYAGLRQNEIRKLNVDDIDMDEGIIRVVEGKGRKSREVPIGGELYRILEEWLQFRTLNTVKRDQYGDPLLFSRKSKRPVLSSGGIMKNLSDEVGFRISWHRCRATYATRLYQMTKDVKLVQHQLGHSTSATTDRYIQLSLQEIRTTINKIGEMYK